MLSLLKTFTAEQLLRDWREQGFQNFDLLPEEEKAVFDLFLVRANENVLEAIAEYGNGSAFLDNIYRPYTRLLDYAPQRNSKIQTYFVLTLEHANQHIYLCERMEAPARFGQVARIAKLSDLGTDLSSAVEQADRQTALTQRQFFQTSLGKQSRYCDYPFPRHFPKGSLAVRNFTPSIFAVHFAPMKIRHSKGLEALAKRREKLSR